MEIARLSPEARYQVRTLPQPNCCVTIEFWGSTVVKAVVAPGCGSPGTLQKSTLSITACASPRKFIPFQVSTEILFESKLTLTCPRSTPGNKDSTTKRTVTQIALVCFSNVFS